MIEIKAADLVERVTRLEVDVSSLKAIQRVQLLVDLAILAGVVGLAFRG